MGWASGSSVANTIWDAVKEHLSGENKALVATAIIDALRDNGWDTLDESMGLIEASPEYHRQWLEDVEADGELNYIEEKQLLDYRRNLT